MQWDAFRLHPSRLWTAPASRVIERREGRSVIAIDGLVCSVCSSRAQRSLADAEGVRSVEVDLERGVAAVEHGPEAPSDEELRAALERSVIGMPVRRWLERLARRSGLRASA
ncbi:MAG: heavy-metal-associated domain-containing protein [Chloroflexi bacterium]|nr:heavy-metal-associated domain-containing protein [Chloroflexota bacterium]